MNKDLEQAKALLENNEEYTCAACRAGESFASEEHGVRPLMRWLNEGTDLSGASAADRIVGDRPALFEVADHPLGVRAQPLRSLQQRVVDVGRGDAEPPRAGRQSGAEVELHRGFDNGVGRLRRPRTVGNRNVPRRRNQHQPRLVGRERQAEIGPVVEPYPIGVECIECIHIKSSYRIRRYQRTATGHPQAPRTGRVFATYLRKDTKSRAQKQASA